MLWKNVAAAEMFLKFVLATMCIVCLLFCSRSRMFHLQKNVYRDFTIAGEGLQNLVLCSALRAFEQGGIFVVPHLL
jgi:hypothetical protein